MFRRKSIPRRSAVLGLLLLTGLASARGAEPAQATRDLLGLLPPDVGVVLNIEDLRGHAHELLGSRLAEDFTKLPAVKAWLDSEKFEQFETARDHIEGLLQASLTEIRDQVLGDAVVVALRLPGEPPLDSARAQGVLLLKAANPELLKRLIGLVNSIQKQNGEVIDVKDRHHDGTTYQVRELPEGSERPADYYVDFTDGTFAISNSESLIHQIIDRKTGASGGSSRLAESSRYQRLIHQLPERYAARLYVDGGLAVRVLKSAPAPSSPQDRQGLSLLERYLGAIESGGAALVTRGGQIALQAAACFDPGRFEETCGRWARAARSAPPELDRVPSTALAVGSLSVDAASIYEFALSLVPEPDRVRVENLERALSGILLGQDLRTRILPSVGPGILAIVDAPGEDDSTVVPDGSQGLFRMFPVVVALELADALSPKAGADDPNSQARVSVISAVENALRTIASLACLDEKRASGHTRVVTREIAGVQVVGFDPPLPFAYAVDRAKRTLVVGNSIRAIERHLNADTGSAGAIRFRSLQSRAFPEARSFFCLDLAGIESVVRKQRERVVESISRQKHRPRDEVSRDVDQVVALCHLFDAAFLSSRIIPEKAALSYTIGLLARDAGPASVAAPHP
jgi:hypothetical protein